jgi:hypothetical protein
MGDLSNKKAWSLHEVKQRIENGEELSTLGQTINSGSWHLAASVYKLKKEFGLIILSYRRAWFGKCAFYRIAACFTKPTKPTFLEVRSNDY